MMKNGWLVAIVGAVALSACGGSDRPDGEDAAGESALGTMTETLEQAGEVEAIVEDQKRRTDAALEEAEDGGTRPQG